MANNGNYWGFLSSFRTDFREPVPVIEAWSKDCLKRRPFFFTYPFFLKVHIQTNGSEAAFPSRVALSPHKAGDGFGILSDQKAAPRLFWEFSRPLINHGEHGRERRKRRKTAWNRRWNALFSSVARWKGLKTLCFAAELSENEGKRHENGVKSCVSRRFSINQPRFHVCGGLSRRFGEILWKVLTIYIYIYIW